MQNCTIRTILLAAFALTILLFSLQYVPEDTVPALAGAYGHPITDGLLFVLIAGVLYTFYRYTIHVDYLTNQPFERQSKFTKYLDAMPEGVAIIDTSQRITYMNLSGKTLLDLSLSPDNVLLLFEWIAHFCESCLDDKNQPVSVSTLTINSHAAPTGPSKTLTVQTRPLYDTQGKLVETITLLRDTSDSSRKDEELKQAYTIADRARAEREIFLANINHDIRTPLNAILGFSELLAQQKTEPDDHSYVEGICASGNNLLALINELLDLSKIESGQLTLEPKPVLLDDILQAISAEIMPKARQKNIQYEVQVDPDVPAVFLADCRRLTQVLSTIGLHAIDVTDEGSVRLNVQHIPTGQLQRAQLVFTMDDSSSAIDVDKLDHVFDCFGQMSDQAMYRSRGSGLGLNITHSLVILMGGTICVQSRPDHGTTFCVRLPVDLSDVPLPTSTQPTPVIAKKSIQADAQVLIVEDNILNQKVMEGYLKRYPLTLTVVNNGLEAVEALQRQAFDLVFMDIQMPVMDGYLATEIIRQQLVLNTPIVAMTAYTMAGEQDRCLSAGMNDYLSKPIRMNQLSNILARFIPEPASKKETTTPTNLVDMGTNIIDESFLNELMDGDDELLAEMVSLFLQDLPTYRNTLFDALDASDYTLFKQTAHKFRSSLNSLAMLDTAKNLKLLETDTTIDPMTKRVRLTGLFEEINQGLEFFEKRFA